MSNISSNFTYVTLWIAFQRLHHMYDGVQQDPQFKDDALALRLSALNMGFFAFEAFLNHIIQTLAPEIWNNERNYFAGRKPIDGVRYHGPIGKLKYVHLLGKQIYDENTVYVQTVLKVKNLRDMMVHGRSYHEVPDDIGLDNFSSVHPSVSKIFKIGTHELLVASVKHFYSLRCRLFDAVKQHHVNSDLGPPPALCISQIQVITVIP